MIDSILDLFIIAFMASALTVIILFCVLGHLYIVYRGNYPGVINFNVWGSGDPTHLQGTSARIFGALALIPIGFISWAAIDLNPSLNWSFKIFAILIGVFAGIFNYFRSKRLWEKKITA